eukprot:GHVU01054678.1.p1 GENE.GHVU01054678.1~~GHVU01054678.1.p1  ORF type:complete len:530 (+),score=45.78 GHVU01054678.1:106-1695(+)
MSFVLKRVLISDEIDEKCINILQQNGIEVVKNTKLSPEQLISEIASYDGLIVRSATKVTANVIAAGKNLKIIGRAGTGVDNIDVAAATKNGVIVMNTPGGNTLSAAEHTCALIMAVSRHISRGTESLNAGRWDRKKFMGNEVYGKTLAIIGLGRIGKEVALRMQSFGMKTIGYDPIIPGEVSAEFGVQWLPLEEIWPQANYITVHTPLIPQTKNLINDDVFTKCPKGVRVINCARGGIIDEEALLKACNDGRCGGAGLDVFIEEPPTNLALVQHPLVTSTPHLGASTVEAQSRVAEEIAQQFVDMVQGKSLFGAINAQALTNALSPETKPWIELGRSLGRLGYGLAGQITKETTIQLITQGDDMKRAGSYLSAAVLVGLLKTQSGNGLNLVSAPAMAKDIGLQIAVEYKEGALPEGKQVTLVAQQPGGNIYQLVGTVAGGSPVLTGVNGTKLPQAAQLTGEKVLYRGQDNPQVLAAITGAIAGAGISINSAAVSTPVNGESWGIVGVSKQLPSVDLLKQHVNFALNVSF